MSFSIQSLVEHVAIAVTAVGGALAARGKHIDLLGFVTLGLTTTLGGGTVRDILAGSLPVGWIRQPELLVNGVVSPFVAFFLLRSGREPVRALQLADAASMALFSWVGARKGLALGFAVPVALLFAVITGVAGGILRDMMLGQIPSVFRPQPALYATAALGGAVSGVTVLHWTGSEGWATAGAITVALALRLGSVWRRIGLPAFERPNPIASGTITTSISRH